MVLPISLVRGFSLLANNTALLYGGVAFVSMIHANVRGFRRGGFRGFVVKMTLTAQKPLILMVNIQKATENGHMGHRNSG